MLPVGNSERVNNTNLNNSNKPGKLEGRKIWQLIKYPEWLGSDSNLWPGKQCSQTQHETQQPVSSPRGSTPQAFPHINHLIAYQNRKELWDQFLEDPQHAQVAELALKTRSSWIDFSKELSGILTDFTAGDLQESSMLAWKHLMGSDSQPIIEDVEGGYFGDIVKFCKDSQGNLQLVLKWFQSPVHFLGEVSAMEKLHNLNLTQSQIVSPVAVGRALHNGKPLYLLAETPAKGLTIKSLIKSFSSHTDESKRREALDMVIKAVAAQGKTLGELHSISGSKENFISGAPEWDIEKIAIQLKVLDEKLLSIDDLVPQIKDLTADYYALPHINRYNHGDPNWGNFLYDAQHHTMGLIDVNFMNFSISKEDGLPKHKVVEDYATVMSHLWGLEKTLKPDEYQEIFRSFDENYKNKIGSNGPTSLELTYMVVNELMMRLKHCIESEDKKNERNVLLSENIQKLSQIFKMSAAAILS